MENWNFLGKRNESFFKCMQMQFYQILKTTVRNYEAKNCGIVQKKKKIERKMPS